jgi:hypothetical protein
MKALFAGPTLYPSGNRPLEVWPEFSVFPPVARGDLPKLTRKHEPGLIVIVDGRFHQSLAVGHAEIRTAIALGWEVWGLGSMGAIRAFEMRDCGMLGFGRVFRKFLSEADFQDDEVALLHSPVPPYPPATEPLVHLRCALEYLVTHGLASQSEAEAIVGILKGQWFGYRTLSALRHVIAEQLGGAREESIRPVLANFEPFRLKTIDLRHFLREAPWKEN